MNKGYQTAWQFQENLMCHAIVCFYAGVSNVNAPARPLDMSLKNDLLEP